MMENENGTGCAVRFRRGGPLSRPTGAAAERLENDDDGVPTTDDKEMTRTEFVFFLAMNRKQITNIPDLTTDEANVTSFQKMFARVLVSVLG